MRQQLNACRILECHLFSPYPSLFVILFSSLSPQISDSGIKGTFLNTCRDLPEVLDTGRADSAQVTAPVYL